MSVLPMKRVFIAALKKDRKRILESLQRLGGIQINTDAGQRNLYRQRRRSRHLL